RGTPQAPVSRARSSGGIRVQYSTDAMRLPPADARRPPDSSRPGGPPWPANPVDFCLLEPIISFRFVPIINRSGEAVMTPPRAAAFCAFLLATLAALLFVASPSPVASQSGGLVPAAVAAEQAGAPASSGAPTINGVDLSPLTKEQVTTALQILEGTRCNCG